MSHSRNGSETFALLENTRDPNAPARRYRNPAGAVIAHTPAEVLAALDAIEAASRKGLHACGYVAYEAGYGLQNLPMPAFASAGIPLLQFQLYAQCEVLSADETDHWLNDLAGEETCAVHDLELAENADHYAHKIAAIHTLIRNGETYQINYTLPCGFRHAGNAAALYRALRKTQPVGFSAFLNLPEAQVLSLSPELFMHKQGNTLTTRPMKGTAARGASPGEDEAIATHLHGDAKSRAENLMIVDLLRNDLGRIAKTGSVHVPSLFQIETYETLHQMTSTVTATLAENVSLADIFSALFPCGSVTGAPKRRTMQHITALEQTSRGIYTGAIGYVEPGGDFCFSVPIRTIVKHTSPHQGNQATMGVGSGIVFDSSADAEYAEVQLKTRFLQEVNRDLGLIESMHLSPDGSIRHLDLHMTRLAHTAKTFGFYLPEKAIRTELAAYTKHRPQQASRRLRLQLDHDGTFSLADFAIPLVPKMPTIVLSAARIDSTSIFRRHKTTRRELYESEYARAVEHGAWEVLFLNQHGRVAECARHNIFVRINNDLVTPPVTEGALPGILRESMKGELIDRPLTLDDLKTADALYVGNAVRGLTRVTLKP